MSSGAGHVGYAAVGLQHTLAHRVLTVALRSARVSLAQRECSIQWRHSSVDLMAGGVS